MNKRNIANAVLVLSVMARASALAADMPAVNDAIDSPSASPSSSPNTTAGAAPNTTADTAPNPTSGTAPNSSPDTTPNTTPASSPNTTPDISPTTAPNNAPVASPTPPNSALPAGQSDLGKPPLIARIMEIVKPGESGVKEFDANYDEPYYSSFAVMYPAFAAMTNFDPKLSEKQADARDKAESQRCVRRLRELVQQHRGLVAGRFKEIAAKAYSKYYSEEQLRDLFSFYASTSGHKFLKVQPDLQVQLTDGITEHLRRAFGRVQAQSGLSFEPAGPSAQDKHTPLEVHLSKGVTRSPHSSVGTAKPSPPQQKHNKDADTALADDLDKQMRVMKSDVESIKTSVRDASSTISTGVTQLLDAIVGQANDTAGQKDAGSLDPQVISQITTARASVDTSNRAKLLITAQILEIVQPAKLGMQIRDEQQKWSASIPASLVEMYDDTLALQDVGSHVSEATLKAHRLAKVAQYRGRVEKLQALFNEQGKDLGQVSIDLARGLYVNSYGEGELRDLFVFYKSAIGQKYLQVQPQLDDEVSKADQECLDEVEKAIYTQLAKEGFKPVAAQLRARESLNKKAKTPSLPQP